MICIIVILLFFISFTCQSATLLTEHFDDVSYEARGWYNQTSQGSNVSGGQSNNCMQWAWTASGTIPANGQAMYHALTATDSLYVSVYFKFESTWRGSQQAYHPHLITFPSDLDDEYCGLASNYLNTYLEVISDIGSPYTIRPATGIQDSLRVNTGSGTPPNDLTATTETRSAAYCNGCKSGADCGTGICYDAGGGNWYSANLYVETTDTIPKNEWVHYEAYYKMNTITSNIGNADGLMYVWVNGTKVMNNSHVVYRTNQDATKKWDKVVLSPWIGDGSPITQTMWIDELVITTEEPYTIPEASPATLSGVTMSGGSVR